MRHSIIIGTLCILALSGQSWFGTPDPNDGRTWAEIKALSANLATVTGSYSSDFHMTLWKDGRVWITLKGPTGAEMRGVGSSPWSAAEDLARQSGEIQKAVERALHGGT